MPSSTTSRAGRLVEHDPNVDDDTDEPWDGRELDLPAHIHARASDAAPATPETGRGPGFNLEILLNERSGGDWIFSREPRVTLPLRRCSQQSAWGVPALTPEVMVFYKATAYFGEDEQDHRPHDETDFIALLPQLATEEQEWLRDAISLAHPGHPWLAQLSG